MWTKQHINMQVVGSLSVVSRAQQRVGVVMESLAQLLSLTTALQASVDDCEVHALVMLPQAFAQDMGPHRHAAGMYLLGFNRQAASVVLDPRQKSGGRQGGIMQPRRHHIASWHALAQLRGQWGVGDGSTEAACSHKASVVADQELRTVPVKPAAGLTELLHINTHHTLHWTGHQCVLRPASLSNWIDLA